MSEPVDYLIEDTASAQRLRARTEGVTYVFLRGRSGLKILEDSIIEFTKDKGIKIIVFE